MLGAPSGSACPCLCRVTAACPSAPPASLPAPQRWRAHWRRCPACSTCRSTFYPTQPRCGWDLCPLAAEAEARSARPVTTAAFPLVDHAACCARPVPSGTVVQVRYDPEQTGPRHLVEAVEGAGFSAAPRSGQRLGAFARSGGRGRSLLLAQGVRRAEKAQLVAQRLLAAAPTTPPPNCLPTPTSQTPFSRLPQTSWTATGGKRRSGGASSALRRCSRCPSS